MNNKTYHGKMSSMSQPVVYLMLSTFNGRTYRFNQSRRHWTISVWITNVWGNLGISNMDL